MTEPPVHPTPDDLERLLLGASRKYTREDVAAEVGISVEKARMYWRALGFPDTGGAVAFTIWDIEALRGALELVESGRIDESTAVQMVRALGRMTGRLAEWHVETLAAIVEAANEGDDGGRGRLATAYQLGEQLLPEFERLLIYAWRRKLAAAAGRLVAIGDLGEESVLTAQMTVGFADLVSFTRLGDVFGEATNLAARLTAIAHRNVVLPDADTAKELTASADFAVRALPVTEVRGIGVVAPYRVVRRPRVGSPS